jgi:hypothetical protein
MKRYVLALAALALTGAAPEGADTPDAYRARFAVTAAPGGGVQRIALPAAALAASQASALADVRVFDARGRQMPIARAPAIAPALRRNTVAAMPILGPSDGLRVTGMSLQLDEQGRARVAQLDGSVRDTPGETVLLGVLFDTRSISGGARRLTLDADIPASQPVTFTVEASRDLKDWRRIGEDVVFRASGAARTAAALTLDGADLRRDYLRVTWKSSARLLTPVAIRSAALETRPPDARTGVAIDARLSNSATGKTIEFRLQFATPLTAIRIVPTGADLIVPVTISGRDTNELPWDRIGTGVARATDPAPIALSGTPYRTIRIEADERTAGFSAPPTIQLVFAPKSIAFLAAGQAPYTLAAGRTGAATPYLALDSLVDDAGRALPDAVVAAPETRLDLMPVERSGLADGRSWLLWAILIGATGLLAGMAWLLWRRNTTASGPAAPGSTE